METKKVQTKKEWKTPELIALVRNKPEDSVLISCKEGSFLSKSPAQNDVARCQPMILACGACQSSTSA
jgi:hypothetical protein